MSTSNRPSSARTALVAAASGVVLLAAVVGFAVGLPEVAGAEGAEGGEGPGVEALAPLPESLPGDLVSLTSPEMPAEIVEQSGGAEALADIVDSGAANVAELYGEPSAFGIYGRTDGSVLVTVTVGPGEPGLFVPDGTPISPEVQGVARSTLDFVQTDDGVCSVIYAQPIAAGQAADPAELPQRVHCQLGADGLLYDVTSQGLSIEETVAAADALLEDEQG